MIAIPNMDKPKNCKGCEFYQIYNGERFCYITENRLDDPNKTADDCPLIEIPKGSNAEYEIWALSAEYEIWALSEGREE